MNSNQKIWKVSAESNREGEWTAGIYSNHAATARHKDHLDATQDGWNNMVGGTITEMELISEFNPEPIPTK